MTFTRRSRRWSDNDGSKASSLAAKVLSEPPNFYSARRGERKSSHRIQRPGATDSRKIQKQLVTYKRADGVPLSMELYLPPDYKPGTRLPAVMWAYPREYNDADTAGQVQGRQSASRRSPDTRSCSSCWTAMRFSRMPRCRSSAQSTWSTTLTWSRLSPTRRRPSIRR